MDNMRIEMGFSSDLQWQAAQLYAEAFRRKLMPVLRSEAAVVAILDDALDPSMGIAALAVNDLVGIAGIQHEERHFVNFHRTAFVQRFGRFSGSVRYLMCKEGYARPLRPGELLMDGIAVRSDQRGQGTGTRLLQTIFDFAAGHHFKTVRLDVIDTNPRARQLYERMGFVPTGIRYYPFLKPIMGFSSVIRMIKTL